MNDDDAGSHMQDGRMFLSPTLFSTFSQQCRAPILLYLGSSVESRAFFNAWRGIVKNHPLSMEIFGMRIQGRSEALQAPQRAACARCERRQVGSTSTVRWWSIDWWPSSIRHPLRANPGGPPLPDASFTAKVGKSNLFGCAHSPQLCSWDGGDV